MTDFRAQLAAAVRAVTIRTPVSYTWLGRPGPRLAPGLAAELDEAGRRRHLVGTLRDELYGSFYCHGRPAHATAAVSLPVTADPALAEALTDANAGGGSWERGWRVDSVDGDEAVVTSARLRARVAIADCRGPVWPGAEIELRVPKALPALSPGFHTVVSDAPDGPGPGVRTYWHIDAAGAPGLVRAITTSLNATGVAFRLKVADHRRRFDRCDAVVLYLPLDVFSDVRAMLQQQASGLDLRPGLPAFTSLLAPGLGAAEDDGAGGSFGLRRCALLADGLVLAHERRIRRLKGRLETIAERFAEHGVDIDTPYREPALDGQHVL